MVEKTNQTKIRKALVVEGGGMRGIFAAGVLDGFHEQNFDPFDLYVGVSAGACNLASFVCDQPGRNHRNLVGPMASKRFLNFSRYARGGHYMDLDWLWDMMKAQDPLDLDAARRRLEEREFLVVCTSAVTGEASYFGQDDGDWYDLIKASSALPGVYRRSVTIQGVGHYDGGLSDAIPVREAYRRGARSIVVVRSRAKGYVKKVSAESKMLRHYFRKNQILLDAVKRRESVYSESLAFIRNPPADAKIIELAPTDFQKVGRLTQDKKALEHDYQMGLRIGRIFAEHAHLGCNFSA